MMGEDGIGGGTGSGVLRGRGERFTSFFVGMFRGEVSTGVSLTKDATAKCFIDGDFRDDLTRRWR